MEFGTFLLLQSPSAQAAESIYERGVEITQAAEDLGFANMWLAEHHFSTYGYLSRPLTYALHLAHKTRRIRVGTAVIVVHGDDPSKLSKQAQGEKSNLVPSLPLAATAPALCGKLVNSQMSAMPSGGVNTGGGSTSGIEDQGLYLLGAGLLLAAGGTMVARRRLTPGTK